MKQSELLKILNEYCPDRMSYSKAVEIAGDIERASDKDDEGNLIFDEGILSSVFYKYYPRVSHKTADKVIRDIKIEMEKE